MSRAKKAEVPSLAAYLEANPPRGRCRVCMLPEGVLAEIDEVMRAGVGPVKPVMDWLASLGEKRITQQMLQGHHKNKHYER